MAAASGAQVQAALDAIETKFDAEQAKGYRGAKIDPEPNSAYSQETDPTTSPRAQRHGTDFVEIDQFADPNNPRIDSIYGTDGLTDAALAAQDVQVKTDTAPAEVTASDVDTTPLEGLTAPFDGAITAVRIKTAGATTGHASNFRVFTVRNKTKGVNVAIWSTDSDVDGTLADNTYVSMGVEGSGAGNVSLGDEFELVETVGGTGVAHGLVTVEATFNQTD